MITISLLCLQVKGIPDSPVADSVCSWPSLNNTRLNQLPSIIPSLSGLFVYIVVSELDEAAAGMRCRMGDRQCTQNEAARSAMPAMPSSQWLAIPTGHL